LGLVMLRWLCALFLCMAGLLPARADEARARQQFELGVAAIDANRWEDAAKLLEASLADEERAATRFNLILAYHELGRPLEVARHALHFLSAAMAPGKESSRAKAEELLARALRELAILDTSLLPAGSALQIDAAPPALTAGASIYLLPGTHRLRLQLAEGRSEQGEVTLSAGESRSWPRSAPALEPPAPPAVVTVSVKPARRHAEARSPEPVARDNSLASARTYAAPAMAGLGVALALAASGCLWLSQVRANDLARSGVEGSEKRGYVSASERYHRGLDAVIPLAFVGGALMAGAVVTSTRLTQRGSFAWSIASVVAGGALLVAGTFLLARDPGDVVPGTGMERPARSAGSLLAAAGLPFTTYGVVFLVTNKRRVQLDLTGLANARLRW
jgi:hypothetical protein